MPAQTKRQNYAIPNSLSHSSGVISAVFDSGSLQVALAGLVANTLYYLYARTVSGAPTLFFSTSVPSVYRVSFSDATLVGAFYANGQASPAFGSFVNIEGVPRTANPVVALPTFDAGTAFTRQQMTWTRTGKDLSFTVSALKNGSAGTGGTNFQLTMPVNLPNFAPRGGDASNPLAEISQENGGCVGILNATNIGGVSDWIEIEMYVNSDNVIMFLSQPSGTGSLAKTAIGANAVVQGFMPPLPLSVWSSTPLKDL